MCEGDIRTEGAGAQSVIWDAARWVMRSVNYWVCLQWHLINPKWGGAGCWGSVYFKFSFMKSECFRHVLACVYYMCTLKPGLLFITGPLRSEHMEACNEGRISRELSLGRWNGAVSPWLRWFSACDVTCFVVSWVGICWRGFSEVPIYQFARLA